MIIVCTPNEDNINTYNRLKLKSAIRQPSPNGITTQPAKARPNVKIGDSKKIIPFALFGIIDSFNNSLTPSVIGCKRPKKPTIFGPWRRCNAANIR